MKVLDLQCPHRHIFEGWFASEEDFLSQCERSLVQCPMCGDSSITKKVSAPRLNLGASRETQQAPDGKQGEKQSDTALAAAWMALARHVVSHTTDVGEHFAEEARKMHYGEVKERAIRGQTTVEEAHALLEEGISVVPLPLPEAAKETLQ